MKRLLAILGVLALLSTLSILAAAPSGAQDSPTFQVYVENDWADGNQAGITFTATHPDCSGTPSVTVPAPANSSQGARSASTLTLDGACNNWTITGVDATGQCTVEAQSLAFPQDPRLENANFQEIPGNSGTVSRTGNNNQYATYAFRMWAYDGDGTGGCIGAPAVLNVDKFVPTEDYAAGAQTTWQFAVQTWTYTNIGVDLTLKNEGPCGDARTLEVQGSFDEPEDSAEVNTDIVSGYIAGNAVINCAVSVTEVAQVGWTLENYGGGGGVCSYDDSSVEDTVVVYNIGQSPEASATSTSTTPSILFR